LLNLVRFKHSLLSLDYDIILQSLSEILPVNSVVFVLAGS